MEAKEKNFVNLILHAYRAEPTEQFKTFQGKKAGRLVAVGPVNLAVTRLFVEDIILECRKHHITKVDILGFEFEMGLFPNVLDEARAKGIDIALRRQALRISPHLHNTPANIDNLLDILSTQQPPK